LVGAVGEYAVELGATKVFVATNVGGGDFLDVFGVFGGGEVEFVEDVHVAVVRNDVGENPRGDVDAVGDGFEFDFVAVDVVVVGDAGVEFADAAAEFGDLDGDGAEFEAAVDEFVG